MKHAVDKSSRSTKVYREVVYYSNDKYCHVAKLHSKQL